MYELKKKTICTPGNVTTAARVALVNSSSRFARKHALSLNLSGRFCAQRSTNLKSKLYPEHIDELRNKIYEEIAPLKVIVENIQSRLEECLRRDSRHLEDMIFFLKK